MSLCIANILIEKTQFYLFLLCKHYRAYYTNDKNAHGRALGANKGMKLENKKGRKHKKTRKGNGETRRPIKQENKLRNKDTREWN